jgi:hypothetical protein
MQSSKRFFAALFFGALLSLSANAQPGGTREELEAMFANIGQKTQWDMSKNMLWGYFFTHGSRNELDAAASELSRKGYRIVNVYLADKRDSDVPVLWWLHVERIETHTIESLLKQNVECVIQPNWTPKPPQTGHAVQRKLDTRSSANWTRIPRQTGHFGRNDAGSKLGFTPERSDLSIDCAFCAVIHPSRPADERCEPSGPGSRPPT